MNRYRRREFLANVGRGMLVASLGPVLSGDLELTSRAFAEEESKPLTFGALEPLASLMAETPIERLLPMLVDRLRSGIELRQLVSAAALANARAFGGQDYEGYHAFMALAPALQMAAEMPEDRRALPVLKVLYRNTNHIRQLGGRNHETLHRVEPAPLPKDENPAEYLRAAMRKQDMEGAERAFAELTRGPLDRAYDDLQYLVQDDVDVHRVVLAWRAWALLDLTGKEHAHTLLRQSVRYCVANENRGRGNGASLRTLLPKLLDQYRLVERSLGERAADDAWVDRLARTIYASTREQAAVAVAAALAEGFAPAVVGEAISLAANQLVLHDPGRTSSQASAGKPIGSIHGASVGVHASDAANAWRNIARVSNRRNTVAGLIVGAYHTAGQTSGLNPASYPLEEHRQKANEVKPEALLAELDAAVRAKDQFFACALVDRMGTLDRPSRPVFDSLLGHAISEDGSLHAEKYYRTVTEEFATTRPAFRWRHLAALARVTASEHGFPAPGYAEACELLKV